jgi:hypothetical protein
MYQARSCHSETAQRAGLGNHETRLPQCFRRPVFLASGLASPGGRPLRAVPGIARAPV